MDKNIIDFEEASREWQKNKKKLKNCYFIYKCFGSSNFDCENKLYKDGFCKVHFKETYEKSADESDYTLDYYLSFLKDIDYENI